MPVAFITVKLPDGGLVHLDVELRTRIEEFRSILAPKTGVKRHRQRLVFAGRLLQDGRTLEAYGVERNSTIFLLHGSSGDPQGAGGAGGGLDITQIPSNLGALQKHVLNNPDILQQMLEAPAMQSLLNDHDFLRSLMKTEPKTTRMLEQCPELAKMLHDKEFMKEASEKMRNPVHVRDVIRSTDRAMLALENLGGGAFDVMMQMCEDIRRPLQDEAFQAQQRLMQKTAEIEARGPSSPEAPGGLGKPPKGPDDLESIPDDDPKQAEDDPSAGKQLPEWVGSFDPNAMASMMQDQNMQHLMAQLVHTLGGPMAKVHPDDPFIDAGFLGQMFHSQTISSMKMLQESVEKLSMAPEHEETQKGKKGKKGAAGAASKATGGAGGEGGSTAADSPQVLSGLHPNSPACNFKQSFALFLAAEAQSPEVLYKGQIQAMHNMGFTDKEACIQALHAADGNMNKAVESLMTTGGGGGRT